MKGTFRNIEKAAFKLGMIDTKMEAAGFAAMTLMALEVERTAKMTIKGSHKKGTPTPSTPGNPPTNITGTLRRSIVAKTTRKGFAKYEAQIGPTVIYGRAVELGHPRWASGINYPFMAAAAKILEGNNRLETIWKKSLAKAL